MREGGIMTIRGLAKIVKGLWEKNAEIQIYDGSDHIETTTVDSILASEDNFYTLSVVHQATRHEDGSYTINLEAPE